MPRLIDANALMRSTDKEYIHKYEIALAPTVDAVEVVRCKDCIYYGDHGDGEMACAMMILYPNKPTDYCSLGERKEDDKTN